MSATRGSKKFVRQRRVAELIAQVWLEPALRQRYEEYPHSVLADFGIPLATDEAPPEIPRPPEDDLVYEPLETASGNWTSPVLTWPTRSPSLAGTERHTPNSSDRYADESTRQKRRSA